MASRFSLQLSLLLNEILREDDAVTTHSRLYHVYGKEKKDVRFKWKVSYNNGLSDEIPRTL